MCPCHLASGLRGLALGAVFHACLYHQLGIGRLTFTNPETVTACVPAAGDRHQQDLRRPGGAGKKAPALGHRQAAGAPAPMPELRGHGPGEGLQGHLLLAPERLPLFWVRGAAWSGLLIVAVVTSGGRWHARAGNLPC